MLYFSRFKTTVIVAICLLGALLCVPNLIAAPASWLPWRTIHLGLDLRGGSYLLLEVDMGAVIRERLDGLADAARQSLRRAGIPQYTVQSVPAQNRLTVRVPDPTKQDAALAAMKELAAGPQGAATQDKPDLDVAANPDGTIGVVLSPVALTERANAAVTQSIEIVRRRIDETGVVDPIINRQGDSRIVVQLPGIEDPNRIKELLGKTARMTFRLTDETANLATPVPPPATTSCRSRTGRAARPRSRFAAASRSMAPT